MSNARLVRRVLVVVFLFAGLVKADLAPEVLWQTDGVPVCTKTGKHERIKIISEGQGKTIVCWMDNRGGTGRDIYALKLNADGQPHPPWKVDGVPVCESSGSSFPGGIVSNGAGGALIAWSDTRPGGSGTLDSPDIYAQLLDPNGNRRWGKGGILVGATKGKQTEPTVVGDGNGGMFIAWTDGRDPTGMRNDIYVQHIDRHGKPKWHPTAGVAACSHPAEQGSPKIIGDDAGGVIVVWIDQRHDNDDIFAQRINANGKTMWSATGKAICTANGNQGGMAMNEVEVARDHAGGAFVTWYDERSGAAESDIYARRIDASGNFPAGWSSEVAVCTAKGMQFHPKIVPDGSGGALITWDDQRNPPSDNIDVYGLRLDAMGNRVAGWQKDGEVVSAGPGAQGHSVPLRCGDGGMLVAWSDSRSFGNQDIYATRMEGDGTKLPGWALNDVPLCKATNAQDAPVIASDGAGGAVVAWRDMRAGGDQRHVYARRLSYKDSADLWLTPHSGWRTPDIWLGKDPATQNEPNKLFARVHNAGRSQASQAKVEFFIQYFAAGIKKWDAIDIAPADLPAGGEAVVSVNWTPKWSGHACAKVEVTHGNDPDLANNMTQENLGIEKVRKKSSHSSAFLIFNPNDDPELNEFQLSLDTKGLPAGWRAEVSPGGPFSLAQDGMLQGMVVVHVPAGAGTGQTGSVVVVQTDLRTSTIVGGLTLDFVVSE